MILNTSFNTALFFTSRSFSHVGENFYEFEFRYQPCLGPSNSEADFKTNHLTVIFDYKHKADH